MRSHSLVIGHHLWTLTNGQGWQKNPRVPDCSMPRGGWTAKLNGSWPGGWTISLLAHWQHWPKPNHLVNSPSSSLRVVSWQMGPGGFLWLDKNCPRLCLLTKWVRQVCQLTPWVQASSGVNWQMGLGWALQNSLLSPMSLPILGQVL